MVSTNERFMDLSTLLPDNINLILEFKWRYFEESQTMNESVLKFVSETFAIAIAVNEKKKPANGRTRFEIKWTEKRKSLR